MSLQPAPWHVVLSIFSFLLGACVGSFLNVCIYRIPRGISIHNPNRSFCPNCRGKIAWYDNIPLLSFFVLRRRCRHCGTPISARYVLVEFLAGLLFLLVWLKLDVTPHRPFGLVPIADWRLVPVYWLAISGLLLGTFVDLEHLIIPDRVTLGGIVAGLVLSPLVPSLHSASRPLEGFMWSATGAALGWLLLWCVAILGRLAFRKEAMGFGDVKLMGAIGAFMGWRAVLFAIVVSAFVGSAVGVTLVLLGRKRLQSRIPYGPYLALATTLWILWGPSWWQAYLNLLLPPSLP